MSQIDFLFLLPERSKKSVDDLLSFFGVEYELAQEDFLLENCSDEEVLLTENISEFFLKADQDKSLFGTIYWNQCGPQNIDDPMSIWISYTLDGKIIAGLTLFEEVRDILIEKTETKYGTEIIEGFEMVPPMKAQDIFD